MTSFTIKRNEKKKTIELVFNFFFLSKKEDDFHIIIIMSRSIVGLYNLLRSVSGG